VLLIAGYYFVHGPRGKRLGLVTLFLGMEGEAARLFAISKDQGHERRVRRYRGVNGCVAN
jgi:hypothetical protein